LIERRWSISNWWENLTVRRDKKTGAVLVKRPHSHKYVDAHTLYAPRDVLVLDLVAGSREREAKERKNKVRVRR